MHSTDSETGEVLLATQFLSSIDDEYDIDMETGEFESNISSFPLRKTKFSIPKELIQPPIDRRAKRCCIDSESTYTLFKKEEVIGLQEVCYLKILKIHYK